MSDRIRLEADAVAPPDEPKPAPAAPEPRTAPPEPRAAPEPPAEPKAAQEPPEAPEGDAEPEAETKETDDATESARKLQARVTRLNREKWEAKRDAAAAQARLDELQRAYQAAQPPQPGAPPADAVELAKQQLRAEQAMREFNEACNRTAAAGRTEFGSTAFDEAIGALNAVGAGQRPDFLEAVTQIPDGHRLYPLLAADLDNAGRILALPPLRMAVELAKLALVAPTPAAEANGAAPSPSELPPVSQAPPPIRPIRGVARNPNPANETMAEFIKRRDKEEGEKRRI
jgi:hypothetical protein